MFNNIQGIGGIGGNSFGSFGAGAMQGIGQQQGQQQGQGPNMQSLVQNIASLKQQGMDTNSIAQQIEQTMPPPPPPPQGQEGQQAQGQQGQQPPPKPDMNSLVSNVCSMLDQGMDVNSIAQQLQQTMPPPPQGPVDSVQLSGGGMQDGSFGQMNPVNMQAFRNNFQ
jgi:hypothetical protein